MTYPPPPSSGDQPQWPSGGQSQGGGMPPPPSSGQPAWPGTPGTQPMPYQPQGGSAPGYQPPWPGPGGPKQPGSGGTAKWILGGLAGGVVLVLIIALVGTAVRGKPASSSGSPGSGSTQAGSAPAGSAPASAGSSDSAGPAAPAGTTSGPIGTTFKVVGFDHSQNTTTYDVTLLAVSQSAAPSDSFNAPKSGNHLAYAKIKVTGVTGHAQDDANLDAVAHGSNSQVYQPSFDDVAAGTNFSAGDFDVEPGQSVIGYVSYEMPNSATITSLTWNSNLQGKIVTWTV
jgi:hypothetical protein